MRGGKVGRYGRTWNIHVRAIDVLAGGQEITILTRRRDGLSPRPRSMPPGKEDEEQFRQDVGVGYVEVMLQRRDVDVSAKLLAGTHGQPRSESRTHDASDVTHIATNVLLPRHHRRLPNLKAHLRRRIVEEGSVARIHARTGDAAAAAARLRLIGAAIGGLRCVLRRRRGRRAHHRHGRDMLRHRVVQRRGVRRRGNRVRRPVHGSVDLVVYPETRDAGDRASDSGLF